MRIIIRKFLTKEDKDEIKRGIMALLAVICFALWFTSTLGCNEKSPRFVPHNELLIYFMDTRTNLCYADFESITWGNHRVHSIACVPCDSIKKEYLTNKLELYEYVIPPSKSDSTE